MKGRWVPGRKEMLMDESLWGLVNIVGPLILLGLLAWLVLRSRRRPGQTTDTTAQTEQATRAEYAD